MKKNDKVDERKLQIEAIGKVIQHNEKSMMVEKDDFMIDRLNRVYERCSRCEREVPKSYTVNVYPSKWVPFNSIVCMDCIRK